MTQTPTSVNTSASPSTAWEEHPEPDEQKLFEDFANRFITLQQKDVSQETNGPLLRGFHAKLHAGVLAEFHVLADLPAHARFGVFSEPRIFPAVVRFSNGKPKPGSDKRPEPRGIAIKLLGVSGPKLLTPMGKEDAQTQDFLATSHSLTGTVRNMRQFIAFVEAQQQNALTLPFTLARRVGFGEARRILVAFVRTVVLSRVSSMATEHYAGTAPIKMGPYAVKFMVRPPEGTEQPAPRRRTPDFLRDELADRLRKGDVLFDFVVQFYVDDKRTPIEDTAVRWEPEIAPFIKVAQLRIPSCDLDKEEVAEQSRKIDELSFSPWHATEDHRPLGNVMRARRVAYRISSKLRGGCPEPTSLSL